MPVTKLYDLASTILEQKLSQIQGVGQVGVQGGGTPSVRVEVNPTKLESFGLTLGKVQSVLSLQNSHEPRGQLSNDGISEDIITNDQISEAADYRPLIIGYHNGEAVRLSDVADVVDSTQNLRAAGYIDGTKGVVLTVFRQPGANIIDTVDRVKAQLPFLEAVLPAGIKTTVDARQHRDHSGFGKHGLSSAGRIGLPCHPGRLRVSAQSRAPRSFPWSRYPLRSSARSP